jgi:cell division protein FtsI (penicillin-binding protein 3)
LTGGDGRSGGQRPGGAEGRGPGERPGAPRPEGGDGPPGGGRPRGRPGDRDGVRGRERMDGRDPLDGGRGPGNRDGPGDGGGPGDRGGACGGERWGGRERPGGDRRPRGPERPAGRPVRRAATGPGSRQGGQRPAQSRPATGSPDAGGPPGRRRAPGRQRRADADGHVPPGGPPRPRWPAAERGRPPAREATFRRGNPVRRLRAGVLGIAVVLSLFAGRLVQLQGMQYGEYRAMAQHERLHDLPIPAVRGLIEGADGTPLAMTVDADLVYADPTQMVGATAAQTEAERSQYASVLAGPLGLPAGGILAKLDHPTSPEYVVLKDMVTPQGAGQINALRVNGQPIPGIAMTHEYERVYPDGPVGAGLLGATTTDASGVLHGAAGIEYSYDSLLSGRSGSQVVQLGAGGQPIPAAGGRITPAVPGRSVRLTILPDVQWEAEQACAARVKQVKADSCMAVVMQPRTGQVLAIAAESAKGGAGAADPAVSDVFEPGSTAKVITAAAALERGGQTPGSPYTVPYQIVVDGFQFHDADLHPTERLTLAGVLVHSSNVGMVQVVQHVSPQVQFLYFKNFGIGQFSGVGLPGESPGILAPPGQWWGNQRYTLAFGQGVDFTALQLASVYATIANGGVRVAPTVVAGTADGHGNFVPAKPPPHRRVLQQRTSAQLLRILQWVPKLDIGPWGLIPGYAIAAKTGTAQRSDPACGCLRGYNSSYVGIAPADNPQLVVAVVVENPRSADYYGNAVAGPVFGEIMKFALEAAKVPPAGVKTPNVRLTAP